MIDFDRFMQADFALVVRSEIKQIERSIQEIKTECGSCKMWMTDSCPREKRMKVSGGMSICELFQMQPLSEKVISNLQLKIQELDQSIQNP